MRAGRIIKYAIMPTAGSMAIMQFARDRPASVKWRHNSPAQAPHHAMIGIALGHFTDTLMRSRGTSALQLRRSVCRGAAPGKGWRWK